MAPHVLTVCSSQDLEAFINFPYVLYRNNPFWVPPLKQQERELLSPGLHPFWNTAEQKLFIIKRNDRVIGRIAAIVDYKYNEYANEDCGAFGFFECEEDSAAAHALLDAASNWLSTKGMRYMRGPVNPSTNYTCGLFIHGDTQPAIMMPYNFPYYQHLLESWHMHKEQDLFAYRINRHDLNIAPKIQEQIHLAAHNPQFTCRRADKRHLSEDIKTMLKLYRESWAENWYFSPLSKAEEQKIVADLIDIIDTNFFVLFFHRNEAIAGMVALPDLTPFLKAIQGNLSIAAPYAYFKTKKYFNRGLRIMLFGIKQEYRMFGLPALLFNYMLDQAQKKSELEWVEGSWVLEDNLPICELIEDFSGKISHRYRIYRKDIFYL
ncbi:MAG: hypothetical protein IK079_02830 [Desulfovibrio sp.]|nr:hypothetical protein [Desulfovibrio sp.]